jgi:hypothetical protein
MFEVVIGSSEAKSRDNDICGMLKYEESHREHSFSLNIARTNKLQAGH